MVSVRGTGNAVQPGFWGDVMFATTGLSRTALHSASGGDLGRRSCQVGSREWFKGPE